MRPQTNGVIQWLLGGDPAIRWQTLRDLAGASERTVERERRRVAREGWGARLLAKQDPGGTWAGGVSSDGGLYSPKWISTNQDGRWPLQHVYKGKTYFELERLGARSRWNTLRALRVLKWWDRGARQPK